MADVNLEAVPVSPGADHNPNSLQKDMASHLGVKIDEVTPTINQQAIVTEGSQRPGAETNWEDLKEDVMGSGTNRITDSYKLKDLIKARIDRIAFWKKKSDELKEGV